MLSLQWGAGILAALVLCWAVVRVAQRRLDARQRITAARVRSGYVPLEIPNIRESLTEEPDTLPEAPGRHRHDLLAVNEQPRMHIRYLDVNGKMVGRTIQVEYLDIGKRTILSRADALNEARIVPLEAIRVARNAETGRRFDLDVWVKAVQVARHKRTSLRNDFDDAARFV